MNKQERMKVEAELTKMAEEFLQKNYQMELTVPVKINARFKRMGGRFVFNRIEKRPEIIEIALNYIQHGNKEIVEDILHHELIHYALCVKGEPYQDEDENFQQELRKYHVPSSLDTGMIYEYECEQLHVVGSVRKLRSKKWVCSKCGSRLRYINER